MIYTHPRVHQGRQVVLVHQGFRDRQDSLATRDPVDNLERRECQGLTDHKENEEILEQG